MNVHSLFLFVILHYIFEYRMQLDWISVEHLTKSDQFNFFALSGLPPKLSSPFCSTNSDNCCCFRVFFFIGSVFLSQTSSFKNSVTMNFGQTFGETEHFLKCRQNVYMCARSELSV